MYGKGSFLTCVAQHWWQARVAVEQVNLSEAFKRKIVHAHENALKHAAK